MKDIIQRIGILNAIILAATILSLTVWTYLVVPHIALPVTALVVTAGLLLAVWDRLNPAQPGTWRHRYSVMFRVPGWAVFGVLLTGFLTLCLFIAPVVWICAAGYAVFTVVVTMRPKSNPQDYQEYAQE